MEERDLRKYFRLWAPVAVWAGVIFAFSTLPTKTTSDFFWQDFLIKKTAHVVEYAILATLLYRGLKESGVAKKKAGFIAVLISTLYAISDEFHQSFTPGRKPAVRDVVFDTIGASFAIYSIWNILPKAPEKLRSWARNLDLL